MRILGIDPGYAILGYGILDMKGNHFSVVTYGSLITDAAMDMPSRLCVLHDGISRIIDEYQPEEASIEELFFNNNAKTAILVGEARGVAVLACAKKGLKINEYTPLQIKQAWWGTAELIKNRFSPWLRPFFTLKKCPSPTIQPMHLQQPSVTGTVQDRAAEGSFASRREYKN